MRFVTTVTCFFHIVFFSSISFFFQIPTDLHPATRKSALETVLTVLLLLANFLKIIILALYDLRSL